MIKQLITLFLFWGSIATILYVYIGFPLILAIKGLISPKSVKRDHSYRPSVTVVIVAYNEAEVIIQKLDNIFEQNYPAEKLQVICASDGSDDGMNELVSDYKNGQVELLALPRQGKNRTLNAAIKAAKGDILVFSDADSSFTDGSLQNLIAPFADETVGGVAGDYRYPTDVDGNKGEQTYWSFDHWLKKLQSQGGNVTSATGQIYAIRRSIFKTVPMSVTDDFYTSVQVPAAHYRLIFEPTAVTYGPIAPSSDAEFRRKVRSISRGLRGVYEVRHLLNPFEYGFYALQLFTHKVLRRTVVIPVIVLGMVSPLLWQVGWLYKLATLGQAILHGCALAGYLLRDTVLGKSKLLTLPLYFDIVYTAAGIALFNLIRGKRYDTWGPERNETP